MSIDLVTKFAPYTDFKFKAESKISLLTNQDFDFVGARIVKVYKISTAEMNDYVRHPVSDYAASRYGTAKDLDATTESFEMTKIVRSHSRLTNWMRTKQISSSQRQRHLPDSSVR